MALDPDFRLRELRRIVSGIASSSTTLTGDVTGSGSGSISTTIANDVVTFAKMQNVAANSVPARAASTSGDLSAVSLAASQLFGRGSTGDLAAITLGTNLSMSGTTLNASGGGGLNPAATVQLSPFNDFTGAVPGTGTPSDGWYLISSLGGSIQQIASTRGLWQLFTGGNANAIAALARGSINNITVGGGEIVIPFMFRVPTASTSSERLYVQAGLRDAWDSGTANNRILVFYTDNVNGGAFQLLVRSGGVDTLANGTVTLVANTYYYCKLVINAAGTEVKLHVGTTVDNAVVDATVSSGIPTAAMRLGILVGKSVGTSSRTLDVDFYGEVPQTLTTAR